MFLFNTQNPETKEIETKPVNVDDMAHHLAEIPNTMNIFFFIACRNKLKEREEGKKEDDDVDAINKKAFSKIE